MPPATATSTELILEGHEQRLQNIEKTSSLTSERVAASVAYQKSLFKRLEEVNIDMKDGFNDVVSRIGEKLDPMQKDLAEVKSQVLVHQARLTGLEGKKIREGQVKKWALSVIGSVLLAVASAVATHFWADSPTINVSVPEVTTPAAPPITH